MSVDSIRQGLVDIFRVRFLIAHAPCAVRFRVVMKTYERARALLLHLPQSYNGLSSSAGSGHSREWVSVFAEIYRLHDYPVWSPQRKCSTRWG